MFRERLRKLREDRNISYEQMAQLMNVSEESVRKWEEKGSAAPSLEQMLFMSRLFAVSLDYLLGFTDKPDAPSAPVAGNQQGDPGGAMPAKAASKDVKSPARKPPKKKAAAPKSKAPATPAPVEPVDKQQLMADPIPQGMIPASLLRKICALRPEEIKLAEAYITRLLKEREDYYVYC